MPEHTNITSILKAKEVKFLTEQLNITYILMVQNPTVLTELLKYYLHPDGIEPNHSF